MKKNVILLRVSTDMQDFDSQKKGIDDYVKRENIVVHEVLEESGVSGYKTKLEDREVLQKLMNMANNNELNSVIVFNQDRIGRRTEFMAFMAIMSENGVKVYSVTEGLLNEKNNDTSEFMQFMKFWMGSMESKKTSARVKSGIKKTIEETGYIGGTVNFGYKLGYKESKDKESKVKILVIDEDESEIVKFIFKNYIEEGSQKTIDKLNIGMLKRGEKWTKSKLFSVLKNTIYIGKKKHLDRLLDFPEYRIIDDELYNLAQDRAKSRNQKGDVRYTDRSDVLFEGLLYHSCGDGVERKLIIDYVKGKNGSKNHTYRCKSCKESKAKVLKSFNSKVIEPLIISNIKSVMNNLSVEKLEKKYNEEIEENISRLNSSIAVINKEMVKKNKAIDGFNKELVNIFAGESNMDKYYVNDMVKKLKLEVREMEENLNRYKIEIEDLNKNTFNAIYLLNKYKDFETIFDMANNEEKKQILQHLINRIVITEDEIKINLNLY